MLSFAGEINRRTNKEENRFHTPTCSKISQEQFRCPSFARADDRITHRISLRYDEQRKTQVRLIVLS